MDTQPMDTQPIPVPVLNSAGLQVEARQAAQTLGALLRLAPVYEAFLKALKAVNSDSTVQKLGAAMRSHQTAMQWGRDPDGQHAAELARLEMEVEGLPSVKDYRQAETAAQQLFRAVDQIVSQEAGVDFAKNAQRSGCGCGG